MPFKPGQSGNPAGRPKGKSKGFCASRRLTDMLRLEVHSLVGNSTKLELLARALIDQALKGNLEAIKEIADRLDGRVAPASQSKRGSVAVRFLPSPEV